MKVPHFSACGDGARTLVFLHGVGGSHAAWSGQLAHFASRGYRAVAWDQPGYGQSADVEPYDLQQIAAACASLLDALGPEPVTLIGHSMGGFVAQEVYARYPHRIDRLVLCFTSSAFGGSGSDFARQFIEARIAPLDRGESMADIAARLVPTMGGGRSDAAGLAHAERIMAAVPSATYRKAVALLTTFDRRAQLASIRVPTLLIAGSDDRTAPASVMERMAQRIPHAQFVVLEGCGHMGPMDQPLAFNRALEDLLARPEA